MLLGSSENLLGFHLDYYHSFYQVVVRKIAKLAKQVYIFYCSNHEMREL